MAPEPHLRPQRPYDWKIIMYHSIGANLGGFYLGMIERFVYRRFIRDWLVVRHMHRSVILELVLKMMFICYTHNFEYAHLITTMWVAAYRCCNRSHRLVQIITKTCRLNQVFFKLTGSSRSQFVVCLLGQSICVLCVQVLLKVWFFLQWCRSDGPAMIDIYSIELQVPQFPETLTELD